MRLLGAKVHQAVTQRGEVTHANMGYCDKKNNKRGGFLQFDEHHLLSLWQMNQVFSA